MPQVFRVSASVVGAAIRARGAFAREAIVRSMVRAAHRGRAIIIDRHNKANKVDQGLHKNSWKVKETARGADITNDAPYAGIIERGARPHAVSREGIEMIAAWVRRKLRSTTSKSGKKLKNGRKYNEDEALSIAYAIAAKIRKQGQKGTFIVRDSIPALSKALAEEVDKALAKMAAQATPGRFK